MKGSDFIFDCVKLLQYGSHIDSPDWIKIKKATINPINKEDDKCFQYAATVALNWEKN